MLFGTSGVLGIDLGPHHLRVLQGALAGQSLKVYDFAQEEVLLSSPENIAQQLERLVERKKLRASPAALILSGPGVVHRLLDFPPMPLNELAVVVEREMRAVGGLGEDSAFDWEVIEEGETGGIKQIRVLVAIAPKAQVDEAQRLLDQCRLKPALFTTAPIALLRSLRFVQSETTGFQAILYLGGEQGYLVGARNGVWSFYREFFARGPDKGGEGLLDEAMREANRVLLYHGQRYGEKGGMTFLLGGEKMLEELRTRLHRETGIESDVSQAGPGLDLTPLGEKEPIFQNLFPSFMIPLGLVAGSSVERGINLVPKKLRKKVSRRISLNLPSLGRPALVLVVIAALFGIHLFLDRVEGRYQRLLKDRTTLYAQWLPAIRAAEESRALREREKLVVLSLGSRRIGEPEWVALFKTLSRIAPPDLALQSMTIERDKGKWRIVLKGEVASPDTYMAQAAFNRFYQGLKRSPYLEEIELLPLNVVRLKEKTVGPGKQAPDVPPPGKGGEVKSGELETQRTKVEFEVRGYAKET